MKKILFAIAILSMTSVVMSQHLQEIYRKGVVKLVPDTEYARGNNWDQVFESFNDTLYSKHIGNRKSLVVLTDGSIVISHAYKNYYSLFDPNGKFVREFKIKKSNGESFSRTQGVMGILDHDIIYTGLDNVGNMLCFDKDGNHKKTLKLDYMTKQMIPLPDGKIAVVGWAIWKTKFRDFVAVVDYKTNEQKIIWDQFTDRQDFDDQDIRFQYSYKTDNRGIASFNTMSVATSMVAVSFPPKIEYVNGNLIVAIPRSGEILIYDLEGNQISKDMANWESGSISIEEQKKIQLQSMERFRNMTDHFKGGEVQKKERERVLQKMKEDWESIREPIPLPSFSTLLKDSDGNLLFFEFPEEDGANKFNVWIYNEGGNFLCQSSFVCDDYNLELIPSKMVFRDGYIYSLQVLKESRGVPLRLVRFKVT